MEKLSYSQQRKKDLIEWVRNQPMPNDFRDFDKATTELLMACYDRYIHDFMSDARSAYFDGYDIRQLTLYEFVKEGRFDDYITEFEQAIYEYEHDL